MCQTSLDLFLYTTTYLIWPDFHGNGSLPDYPSSILTLAESHYYLLNKMGTDRKICRKGVRAGMKGNHIVTVGVATEIATFFCTGPFALIFDSAYPSSSCNHHVSVWPRGRALKNTAVNSQLQNHNAQTSLSTYPFEGNRKSAVDKS